MPNSCQRKVSEYPLWNLHCLGSEKEWNVMKDLQPIISGHPFFKGMKSEHLEVLVRHAREDEFKSGQTILRQSQAAYELYLITQGQVAVECYAPRADDVPVQVLAERDVLGWSWLFPPFNS